MQKNLEAYVKIYPNMIEDFICDATINELQRINWQQHLFYDVKTNTTVNRSGDKELEVSNDITNNNTILMNKVWDSYQKYLQDLNFHWFARWQGYSQIRFNRYKETSLMAMHCDHIHSLFDGEIKGIPIMTALGALNDDYEGGNFIMFDDDVIEMKKGSIVVFPSNFLYPHRVEPVTKGERYTFVAWAW